VDDWLGGVVFARIIPICPAAELAAAVFEALVFVLGFVVVRMMGGRMVEGANWGQTCTANPNLPICNQ